MMNTVCLKRYLAKLNTNRFSPGTIILYRQTIGGLLVFLGDKDLSTVRRDDVRAYLVSIMDQNNAITLNTIIVILRGFFSFMVSEEFIKVNPCNGIEKHKRKVILPAFALMHEIERLYTLMDEDPKIKVRDVMMFDIFYGTGIRTSELCNLKISDYSVYSDWGFFRINAGKGNKDREVTMQNYTKLQLDKYLVGRNIMQSSEPYLFLNDKGKKFSRQHVYIIMSKILGKMYDRKRGGHRLRHTFATHLLNQTGNIKGVQIQLGHKTIASTEGYTHIAFERVNKVYRSAHPKS